MKNRTILRCILSAAICSCCLFPAQVFAASSAETSSAENSQITDFSVKLFQASMEDGANTLISPLSVLSALSMTANGAAGSTLEQIENVFGLPVAELNKYFSRYLSEEDDSLSIANSVWINDSSGLPVSPDFTEAVSGFYRAEWFEEPMDGETLQKINDWVNEKTEGMIPQILDQIPEDALMYLINALTFQAKWEEVYEDYDVYGGVFTEEDGTELETDMMRSTESTYLEGESAEGFLKYYEGGKYAFAALLPDESIPLDEYAESLTGEELREILSEKKTDYTIHAEIPKFTSETETELSQALKNMGITDAFSDSADFSGLFDTEANPGVQISRVIHKTFIEVNEQETKASAATAVEIAETAYLPDENEKYISLNRPFLYMLVDCEENIPLFIGTMYTPEE